MAKTLLVREDLYTDVVNLHVVKLAWNLYKSHKLDHKKTVEVIDNISKIISDDPEIKSVYIDFRGRGDFLRSRLMEQFPKIDFKDSRMAAEVLDTIQKEEEDGKEIIL